MGSLLVQFTTVYLPVSYTHLEKDEKSEVHCEREIDKYFDNTVGNNNNLPDVLMSIVNEYNDTNDRRITKNTDGERFLMILTGLMI